MIPYKNEFYYRHVGIHLKPIEKDIAPKVILMLRCRLGNQLHQVWIAQRVREFLKRPLHVVLHSNAEGFNIYESGLLDIPKYDSQEHYHLKGNPLYKCVHNCSVHPFVQLINYGDTLHKQDVVLNVLGECWTYIGEFEEYIRSLYRVRNPLPKRERITIHLRLGDVVAKTTYDQRYISYAVQTVKRIFIKQQERLPLCILAEDTNHPYTKTLEEALRREYDSDVLVFNHEDPCDDFRELMASSHIIATNSTFTFWAAFLAEPQTTEVYIGLSKTQPIPSRNEPLYMHGSPGNFHVADIDKYQEYIPRPMFMGGSIDIPTRLRYETCILFIVHMDVINDTMETLKLFSDTKIIVVCLDKYSYDQMKHHAGCLVVRCQREINIARNAFVVLDILSHVLNHVDKAVLYINAKAGERKNKLQDMLGYLRKDNSGTDILYDKDNGSMLVRNTPGTRKTLNYNGLCDARMMNAFGNSLEHYLKFVGV